MGIHQVHHAQSHANVVPFTIALPDRLGRQHGWFHRETAFQRSRFYRRRILEWLRIYGANPGADAVNMPVGIGSRAPDTGAIEPNCRR